MSRARTDKGCSQLIWTNWSHQTWLSFWEEYRNPSASGATVQPETRRQKLLRLHLPSGASTAAGLPASWTQAGFSPPAAKDSYLLEEKVPSSRNPKEDFEDWSSLHSAFLLAEAKRVDMKSGGCSDQRGAGPTYQHVFVQCGIVQATLYKYTALNLCPHTPLDYPSHFCSESSCSYSYSHQAVPTPIWFIWDPFRSIFSGQAKVTSLLFSHVFTCSILLN